MKYKRFIRASMIIVFFGIVCFAVGFIMGKTANIAGAESVSASELNNIATPTQISSQTGF